MDVVRFIEDYAAEPLDLGALAGISGSSKYHFLRAVGMTPYQFLLTIGIPRAALRLACTSETVASIAFGAGFGNLSTFNRRFRDPFGMSPLAYRRREARRDKERGARWRPSSPSWRRRCWH
jgi:AraC family transcriptional regulator